MVTSSVAQPSRVRQIQFPPAHKETNGLAGARAPVGLQNLDLVLKSYFVHLCNVACRSGCGGGIYLK